MASDPISKPSTKHGSGPKSQAKKTPSDRGKLSLVAEPEKPEQQTLESPAEPGPAPTPADDHVPALSADLSADTLPPDTARALSALVHEHARLGTRIADLKSSQDELKAEIESICFEIPAKRISGSGWHTTRSRNSKTKTEPEKLRKSGVDESAIAYAATQCDKNKLAEKGVDPAVIARATVTTFGREFVLPVVEKEKDPK